MKHLSFAIALCLGSLLQAQNAVTRSLFDPDAYTPLNGGSAVVLQSGDVLAIDTTALTITRNGSSLGTGVAGHTGGPSPQSVALFTFTSLTVPSGIAVSVTGTRALGLLARENLTLGSVLDVSASSTPGGAPGAGGGGGGNGGNLTGGHGSGPGGGGGAANSKNPGAGGGHGGAGEVSGGSTAGIVYGDAALSDLRGGSGGGGGSGYDSGFNSYFGKDGGGGGGAILLLAQNSLTISAPVRSNGGKGVNGTQDLGSGGGGSGGAIVLVAAHVSVSGTTLNADGGSGGFFTSPGFGPSMGGGGGRIALYSFSAPPAASTFQARQADITYSPFPFPNYSTTYTASGTVFRSTVDEPAFVFPASLLLQPQISGLAVSDATETTATLRASIRPGAIPATAAFEYGLTTGYGSTVVVTLSPDSGTALQSVSTGITGLVPLTLYHYRLRAANSSQTTFGPNATFFTPGSPIFSSGTDTPITVNGFTATGLTITPALNFAPTSGTLLTLVNNTGGTSIVGELANISEKGTVTVPYGGVDYTFIATYFGGTGNDLVLMLPGPGVLDYTFGRAGRTELGVGGFEGGKEVAVQPDGKILIGGNSEIAGNHDFVLLRLNPDGTPDSSFNVTGSASASIGSETDTVTAMALQTDGRVIVAGHILTGPNYDFGLARFNPNGTLDPTFNTTGKVITDLGGNLDLAEGMALQADGKIVVVGKYSNGIGSDWALVRYNTNGSLDSGLAGDSTPGDSFGTGGVVLTDHGSNNETASRVAVQPDGKILAAGTVYGGQSLDFAMARYLANGSLDTTFNGTGKVLTPVGTGEDNCEGMALLADGKILLSGNTLTGSNNDTVLVRYNANGSLDTTFNSTGKLIVSLYTRDTANDLAIQSDGKILAMIAASTGTTGSSRYGLARFLADGSLDTSFGGTGFVTSNFSGGTVYDLAIQSDGQILLTGSTGTNNYGVARYEGGLSPEIGVELTSVNALADGAHTIDYGITFPGALVARTFTVRNSGFSNLTGLGITFSGTGAADYAVGISPASPLTGPTGSTTFTVVFNPAAEGVKNALLHLASNDANENSFEIALTGRGLLPEADDDADGLNNAAEVTLSAAGFDPLVNSAPLIATLRNTGLYQAADFQALALGRPVLERSPASGNFHLRLGVKQSINLSNWTPLTGFLPTYDAGTGVLDLEIVPPSNGPHFFQVFGAEP